MVICPYCGGEAKLVNEHEIYGKSCGYGMIWFCGCLPGGSYIGCYNGTDKPRGTLANASLRYWRKRAYRAFYPLCPKNTDKVEAYNWLASRMGISEDNFSIANRSEEECQAIERLCRLRRGLSNRKYPKDI